MPQRVIFGKCSVLVEYIYKKCQFQVPVRITTTGDMRYPLEVITM